MTGRALRRGGRAVFRREAGRRFMANRRRLPIRMDYEDCASASMRERARVSRMHQQTTSVQAITAVAYQ